MTQNHTLQHDYIADLLNTVPLSSTWEIEISLSVEISSDMGFIVIDRWVNLKEEYMMFHRKNANTVFVYSENRSSPRFHDIGAKVILDTIESLNYAHSNTFQQMYVFRKSDSDLIVKGGWFFIDKQYVIIEDLDTEVWDLLSPGEDNYIYIKDNAYFVTTTIDENLYPVAIISMGMGGTIANIERQNVFVIWNWITPEDQEKLNLLNANAYEKFSNKTTSIRSLLIADDIKYPTEKAVAQLVNTKIDKQTWFWLSKNDFSNTHKEWLEALLELNLQNISTNKSPIVAWPWILVQDLWDAWYRIKTSMNNGVGTTGEHIEVMTIDGRSKVKYSDEQRYVILEDEYRSGFFGSTKFKDAINPSITVYYHNPNEAGNIMIDTHIRVVNGLWVMTESHRSIPYSVAVVNWHGAFELHPNSFNGLDFTNSTVMYIKVSRVWAYITDTNGWEFNTILNDLDTVSGEIRIKSMYIDYEYTIELPQAWYAYNHDQFIASDTWTVVHGLNTKRIIIQCYDADENPIREDSFLLIDDDTIDITFSAAVSGTAVILSSGWAAPDTSGDDKNYEEPFSSLSGGGVFTHSLWKYPSVMVLDSNGKEIICEITHQDKNTVLIVWTWTYTGRVVAN